MYKIIKFFRLFFLYIKLLKNNKVILCNTPVHENMGDHAITFGEIEFLKKYYDCSIVEVPEDICNFIIRFKFLAKKINKNDIIFFQGGGFMGDLWPRHENLMKDIINRFPDNLKVIFPQTCFFEKSNSLDKYFEYYSKVNNLIIFTRDEKSYNLLKKHISCVYLVPDIAFLNEYCQSNKRDGVGLCLRNDKERVTSDCTKEIIKNYCYNNNIDIHYFSTINDKKIFSFKRQKELYSLWKKISKNQLIITDRLHGMIFSYITGTPCIAFDNLSNKVSGVYKWIKNSSNVICINSCDFNEKLLVEFLNKNNFEYSNNEFKKQFDYMKKIIDNKGVR